MAANPEVLHDARKGGQHGSEILSTHHSFWLNRLPDNCARAGAMPGRFLRKPRPLQSVPRRLLRICESRLPTCPRRLLSPGSASGAAASARWDVCSRWGFHYPLSRWHIRHGEDMLVGSRRHVCWAMKSQLRARFVGQGKEFCPDRSFLTPSLAWVML